MWSQNMPKETYIKFRCTEQFKEVVEKNAREHGRSVSSYIEYLIRKDVGVMKIISTEYVNEEMENALRNEPTCYLSSNEYYWLFTDINVFNDFSRRFQFDIETEERERIYDYDLEEHLLCKYDGGDGGCDYFGCYIELGVYREKVARLAEQNGLGENWDIQLDKWSKEFAIEEIALKIRENLDEMESDGWDVEKLKKAIE